MKIRREFIERVRSAQSTDDLLPLIQEAIRLEHATIPPYLCAYFTLKLGHNAAVGQVLRSIVIEEMLHMTLAANLLVALGGAPQINRRDFVPVYPGDLPMGIGNDLEVRLRKCSVEQVRDVFMKIEAPDEPIAIRVAAQRSIFRTENLAAPRFETIGLFYAFLSEKLAELGDAAFVGDPARQVVTKRWFPEADEMFLIADVASAQRALAVIIDQGEGTTTSPFETDGAPAHYYRFEQIVRGRSLRPHPGQEPPYSYGDPPLVLDALQVWDMDDDPAVAKYRPGSRSRLLAEQFARAYTSLLNALHEAFNGNPGMIDRAIGVMYELRIVAQQVLATRAAYADGSNPPHQTGLCFEYWA